MRLSISNIAWEPHEDTEVARLLQRCRVDAIDVAPGKYFARPAQAERGEVEGVRAWWAERGTEIVGMQALLFGTQGLNLFGPPESRDTMLTYLGGVCRTAAWLGVRALTFGSPRNRDRLKLSDAEVETIALPFFRTLGDLAQDHGVVICLEPNPEVYGCNYMTGTAETDAVVRRVDHPAIRLQLDTGALTLQGEDPVTIIRSVAPRVGHIHASEPQLVPVGEGATRHQQIGPLLKAWLPDQTVTVEMLPPQTGNRLEALERALQAAAAAYSPDRSGSGAAT